MKKYTDKLLGAIIVCVILNLSIGYSSLNKELNISGEVFYRVKDDIRITDLRLTNTTYDTIEKYASQYSRNSNIIGISLPNENSTITYTVQVTNFSDIEMGIYSITGLPENLTYELNDYILKEKICDNKGNCKAGAVKEFTIIIKYAENGYKEENIDYNLRLQYDFRKFHKIKYTGFNSSTISYPQGIIDGGDLNITFQEPNLSNIGVIIDNKKLIKNQDFSYSNFKLSLNNVQGNVEIRNISTLYKTMQFYSRKIDNDVDYNIPPTDSDSYIYEHGPSSSETFPVYYYRGNIKDNNLLFANFCWKIVRTTETGGVN